IRDQSIANCLIRTKTLDDPTSWRAWSGGKRFDMTFIDPYASNDEPEAHLCKDVSNNTHIDLGSGTITYNSVARQWLRVDASDGGFYYALSPDLINWTQARPFLSGEVPWTYQCGDEDPRLYPALIDPASTSRNFETSGSTAYIYFTQFHYQNCQQTLNRDLVRVPIRIRVS
ncbi:MAG TPA: hypothetical protein VJW23_15235, partial [Propionibacteriaceae bacterium]|nr:hypothetical protein [Propionibacteriaceae bacterium]